MWRKSWKSLLQEMVTHLQRQNPQSDLRIAVVGIGHELRGDDAVGLEVVAQLRPFSTTNHLILNAGHAPENHTGPIRRFTPHLVLLIDAADLHESPGTVYWLRWQETSGLSASTHTMPPYMLARYLVAELGCQVALIGIQTADTRLGSGLTTAVQQAANLVVHELSHILQQLDNKQWKKI